MVCWSLLLLLWYKKNCNNTPGTVTKHKIYKSNLTSMSLPKYRQLINFAETRTGDDLKLHGKGVSLIDLWALCKDSFFGEKPLYKSFKLMRNGLKFLVQTGEYTIEGV